MLNGILLFLIVGATIAAAYTGRMDAVTKASIDSAKTAVELALGLIGQMALWLGMMRILRDGGLLAAFSRALAGVMRPLFPEIPAGHPALGALVMNIAANMLGLANAATPFGLKAMKELDRLNPRKGVATDAMALFLAINTSGVAVMPLGVIAVRGALGCEDPAGIFFPSILATACSTFVAIVLARGLARHPRFAIGAYTPDPELDAEADDADTIRGMDEAEEIASLERSAEGWRAALVPVFALLWVVALGWHLSAAEGTAFERVRDVLGQWLLPTLMALILLFGASRRVRVYESFVAGAKEGFEIAVMIIPFLVAILVGIGMFRASGLLDVLITGLRPLVAPLGFPPEALPMALIRPLSGSGALSVLMDTLKTHGKDSFVGFVVSVMNGSTETTFYVLALYYGSVRVRQTRHTVLACLAADLTGILAAVAVSRLWWG